MSITLPALGRAHRSRGGKFERMADRQSTDPFRGKPLSMVWLDLANAIPERRLDPSGFVITCSPAACAASAMIRVRLATRPGSEVPPARPRVRQAGRPLVRSVSLRIPFPGSCPAKYLRTSQHVKPVRREPAQMTESERGRLAATATARTRREIMQPLVAH
jgi:hypothetical protein